MPQQHDAAELVAIIRDGLGYTQADIARMLNASAETVGRWARGDADPHPGNLAKLHSLATTGELPRATPRRQSLTVRADTTEVMARLDDLESRQKAIQYDLARVLAMLEAQQQS